MLSGCGSSPKERGIHPDFSRLPADGEVNHTIDFAKQNYSPLPDFYHPDSLNPETVLGKNASYAERFYQDPLKTDMDGEGNVYMAIDRKDFIYVYDKEGRLSYKIGGPGRGPGEFTVIDSFEFDSAFRTLYVLDQFEVEVFRRAGGRFEYETSIPNPLWVTYDLCLIGENLFFSGFKIDNKQDLQAYEDGKIDKREAGTSPPISRYSLKTHELTHSFGFTYKSFSGFGRFDGQLSEMRLSCNEQTGTVVAAMNYFPYIFGYDTTGRQKWISKIENYKSSKAEEYVNPNGNYVLVRWQNEEIYHYKYPALEINNGPYAMFQVRNMHPVVNNMPKEDIQPPESYWHYKTLLIDTDTGELFQSDIYPFMGVRKGNHVLTIQIENFTSWKRIFTMHEY